MSDSGDSDGDGAAQSTAFVLARQRARAAISVLRGDPPPYPIAARARDTQDDDLIANDVIDLVLRMGEALLSVGSPVAGVTATVLRTAAAYGLTSSQVDITFTAISLSITRDDGDPVTAMRVVRFRSADYSRLSSLYVLADEIIAGKPLPDALARLEEILDRPHPYRRWLVTLGLAGMAAGVAGLLGGGIAVAIVAAGVTAGIDRLQRRLNSWGLPAFFQQVTGAGFAMLVALAIARALPHLPLEASELRPSLVVASGIVVLLAGLGLVGSVEDAISGYYLTSAARTFEVMLNTVGIVVGIGGVLDVANRAGLHVRLAPVEAASLPDVGLIAVAAAVSGCWALASYAPWRSALFAAGAGGAGFAIYIVARDQGLGLALTSALAALFIGVVADVAGERLDAPALAVATSAIVPLLPGLAIYRALYSMVDSDTVAGLTQLLGAIGIGLGLASGVALGSYVARPLRRETDRWERRVRRYSQGNRD